MVNLKEKFLLRDNLKRTYILKYKYFYKINKSLYLNRTLSQRRKIFAFYNISVKFKTVRKIKNICSLSGSCRSVNKNTLFSRYQLNYLSILNKLQNFKVNSW